MSSSVSGFCCARAGAAAASRAANSAARRRTASRLIPCGSFAAVANLIARRATLDAAMAAPSPPSERRPVGPLALLALGVNGIVGVGIFFAPADIAQRAPGGASVLVFVLTALALVPVALAFAVLGSRFGEDGGPVVFARAAFGEAPAFLVGWIAYVSAIASSSAVNVGLATALAPQLGLESA